MAASSSDESCTAPKDFHLSSSIDSGSRLSPNHKKCQLCSSFRKTFYCKDCINSGNFYSSNSHAERFADKQLRLLELKSYRKAVEDACVEVVERVQKEDALRTKTRLTRDRIQILKLAIEEKVQKKEYNGKKLSELRRRNDKLLKSLPKYEERVEKLKNYVNGKRDDMERTRESLCEHQKDLKKFTRIRTQQLIKYIFPIVRVEGKAEMESSDPDDMVSALAEASQTMYIRDRWVTDHTGGMQYSIVAPTLPGSGNYSDYNDWVAQNRNAVTGGNSNVAVEHNPAYRISAALTYTAQLVQVLAFYLDVRLPYKMLYSDFCSSDMTKMQFSRRVARLNANILHLCFSQNTDLNCLRPSETLHNILQLVNIENTDLGRQGPMELDAQMTSSLERQLGNSLQTAEDSDSEEGDSFPVEWEAVPHVQLPETVTGQMNLQSTMSAQQASSMAGGLVTSAAASIASLWRGWTGR